VKILRLSHIVRLWSIDFIKKLLQGRSGLADASSHFRQ